MAYKVYVRTDDAGRVVDINSDAFVEDVSAWILVDEGEGDRYHHAQGHYLEEPLRDGRDIFRYKLVDGKIEARSAEEMDADYAPPEETVDQVTLLEAQIQALSERNEFMEDCIAEMATVLYA